MWIKEYVWMGNGTQDVPRLGELYLNQGLKSGCTKTGKLCVSTRDGTELRASD